MSSILLVITKFKIVVLMRTELQQKPPGQATLLSITTKNTANEERPCSRRFQRPTITRLEESISNVLTVVRGLPIELLDDVHIAASHLAWPPHFHTHTCEVAPELPKSIIWIIYLRPVRLKPFQLVKEV